METTQQHLTSVSIAYSLMFYAAALVLMAGLGLKALQIFRTAKVPQAPSAIIAAAADVFLLRGTFFSNRVLWIFSACFQLGFLLVVIRHLRYAIEPSWVGPAWILIVLEQPLGLYGGLLMIFGTAGYWARLLIVKSLRQETPLSDHAVLGLFLAIPVVGYLNNFIHTDVIAVKDFFLGLTRFHWRNLPADPVLLLHLWLVACLMALLPFSHLMNLPEIYRGSRIARLNIVASLALLLVLPAMVGTFQVAASGWTKPAPDFTKLARAHKKDDPTVMISNHPRFLFHTRSLAVYQGVRHDIDTIEKCVDCHAEQNAQGQTVGFDDPQHFCRGCHNRAAVKIDCFECHNSMPASSKGQQGDKP